MVVNSISPSLSVDTEIISTKHVITWQHAVIKAVFYDPSWTQNGGMVAGIVLIGGLGYGFFLSKNFSKIDSVPRIGMEEFVNVYPTVEIPDPHMFGGMAYICTNIYAPQMKATCTIPALPKLKTIVQDSKDLLMTLYTNYPHLKDPADFIRYN